MTKTIAPTITATTISAHMRRATQRAIERHRARAAYNPDNLLHEAVGVALVAFVVILVLL